MTSPNQKEVLLRPSYLRWGIVVLASVAGVAYGAYLAGQSNGVGWVLIAMFGAALLFGALHFVPGLAGLRLTAHGFEIRTPVRRRYVPWGRVRNLRPGSFLWTAMVRYDLDEGEPAEALEKYVAGLRRRGALPETYGMDASELAEVMNEWRILSSEDAEDDAERD